MPFAKESDVSMRKIYINQLYLFENIWPRTE
jgi:hypothetical protein